jgi:hypothetical protein
MSLTSQIAISNKQAAMTYKTQPVPARIESLIYTIRGLRVMLDSDLATIYNVQTKALNQALKRNLNRFPNDFAFQLTEEELESLMSQIVTSKKGHCRKTGSKLATCARLRRHITSNRRSDFNLDL